MRENLNKKDFIQICFMLFGMIFGAGNLLFPPMLGKFSGNNLTLSIIGFCISGVVLPILGIIVVMMHDKLSNITDKVSTKFTSWFIAITYISTGPSVVIPRAATTPFSIILEPYLDPNINIYLVRTIYTVIFFVIVYFLCLNPSKLVNKLGKILSPLLFILIVFMFLGLFFKGAGNLLEAQNNYAKFPFVMGFLEGYSTLDAVSSINFGIVLTMNLIYKGLEEKSDMLRTTVKAGFILVLLISSLYMMLAFIGASTAGMFANTTNGAEILNEAVFYIFGPFGRIILSLTFLIACLSICISSLICTSEYFSEEYKFLSYKQWLLIWITMSLILANYGLDSILVFTKPILYMINPIAIVLIILGILDKFFDGNRLIYNATIHTVIFISLLSVLPILNINIYVINNIIKYMPFSSVDMAWVIPTFVVFVVTNIYVKIRRI
ncbi:branched-chain amino acid transport system II carrier protein [Pseudostreptobacillus hongkongensis]|uniref:branched-chain amino acid transport system II carrier protein n=1 Tax=Pseudostreptobacillus hongkongensis TaxID=1162717 RepID=UPI000830812B|nr:branched-chain amino acid transport system II carrier protein [Pseudostreptobacillus hongkongensis]